MQNILLKKTTVWFTSILLAPVLAAGCSYPLARENNADLAVSTVTQAIIKPTRLAPEPTEPTAAIPTNQPPTTVNTPSQSDTSEAGFRVCESTSEDSTDRETPASQSGLSMELDSLIPPAPPAHVAAIASEKGVVVTWQGTGTDVDQFYNVYQRVEGDECWEHIGAVPIEDDNSGGYEFYARINGETSLYEFAVTTMDIYGSESSLSMSAAAVGP